MSSISMSGSMSILKMRVRPLALESTPEPMEGARGRLVRGPLGGRPPVEVEVEVEEEEEEEDLVTSCLVSSLRMILIGVGSSSGPSSFVEFKKSEIVPELLIKSVIDPIEENVRLRIDFSVSREAWRDELVEELKDVKEVELMRAAELFEVLLMLLELPGAFAVNSNISLASPPIPPPPRCLLG